MTEFICFWIGDSMFVLYYLAENGTAGSTPKGDTMKTKLTKAQALQTFRQEILPHIPSHDRVAKCEAWNNYTDSLCKTGQITLHQYESWNNPF